jgi:hypothetical protein
MRTEEERQPSMISSSPGSDESSELDQCGDDMLDTVDSVVGCVNQNHAELQHQYEEATYHLHPVRPADQRQQQQQQDQQDRSCIGEEALEAVHCGATEPMGDLMLLGSYSSLATSSEPQQYRQPQQQPLPPPPAPTNNNKNNHNNSARSVSFPVASCSSLYQCQDCSSTKTLRQLQPDVRETIWWPCDRCQRDCRWNPAVTTTTTTTKTTTTTGLNNNINWGDGATAEDGCVIH